MNKNLLSIIIVNYNGLNHLNACISSILKEVKCEYELIVVDNASTDESVEFIRLNYPWVVLIESELNLGFTGGNNLGGSHAKGDLLLLLNTDTVSLTDVQPAIDMFSDTKLGVLGCRLWYEGKLFQPSVGYDHNPIRLVLFWAGANRIIKNRWCELTDNVTEHYRKGQSPVDWVSGAWLMTRKSLWENIGGLDESYFMYVEDVDYCKEVRNKGFRIAYIPEVEIIHFGGGGRTWVGVSALKSTADSYVYYMSKFYNPLIRDCIALAIGVLWICRATLYGISYLFNRRLVNREKMLGYFSSGIYLFRKLILRLQ